MLNITLLNYYYNNININTSNFNHLHLSMSFDTKYIYLASISIASILNTSSVNTYIHFHLLLNNVEYKDIKVIIDLKKINKNVEFIFYNAKQIEYDLEYKKDKGWRGIGDFSRLITAVIVNNTNRILILDCADILAQKDLSELYFFDMEDNYAVFSLEDIAGRFHQHWIFGRNNFYPNSGISLINVRKFREDNLYENAFFAAMAYNHLPCPSQDILLMIIRYKFKYWPLNYNCPQFFKNNEKNKKDYNTSAMNHWLSFQENSPFRYSKKELIEASLDPVIIHLYANKPFWNIANDNNTLMWINYSKMAGVFNEMKQKYPDVFKRFNM